MTYKTNAEVDDEISKLKELKGKVVPRGMAGDNLAAIDAAIEALQERWDESDVDNGYIDDDDEPSREQEIARDAVRWRLGETSDPEDRPSYGWPLRPEFRAVDVAAPGSMTGIITKPVTLAPGFSLDHPPETKKKTTSKKKAKS